MTEPSTTPAASNDARRDPAETGGDPADALGTIVTDLAAHLAWRAGASRAGAGPVRVPPPAPRPVVERAAGAEPAPAAPGAPEPATAPVTVTPTAPVSRDAPTRPSGPLGWAKGMGSPALEAIRRDLGDCARCKLCEGRKNLVFGVGNPKAELVFVGEGPGANEDAQGEPFVGAAGQLLDKMIGAMGYRREDVYIANVVKCRPPGNRDPEPDEVDACEPFLKAQLSAIGPKVIVGLGRFAVQCLLGDPNARISRVRGTWARYEGTDLMPTFHPAYLLRNAADKRLAWQDLKAVMARLGRPAP
jgi:uracil-DNA glycosylase